MPALDQITIKGYKSIKDATIELRPLNVLIGANGAGKSNLVSSLRFLRVMMMGRLRDAVAQQGGAENVLHYGLKVTKELRLGFAVEKLKYSVILIPDELGNLFVDREKLGLPSSMNEGHFPVVEYRSLPESLLREHFVALSRIGFYHISDTSSTAAVKQPSALNDNADLRTDAGNLAAFLYLLHERHRGHYDQIVSLVRRVVPRFDDFALRPDPLNPDFIQLEWREVGSDFPFRAQHLSDGSLRFVCLATLLMQPSPPSTVIIDEPELGLHPVAIELLAEMLRLASERTQVIVATQSPALVNAFTPEDIITVDRVEGATEFQRHTTESLASWLEDYTLGELWEKNVIGGKP